VTGMLGASLTESSSFGAVPGKNLQSDVLGRIEETSASIGARYPLRSYPVIVLLGFTRRSPCVASACSGM